MAASLDDGAEMVERFFDDGGEFRAAMVHDGTIDGAQHAIRDIAGTGNLQKMSAGMNVSLLGIQSRGEG